MNKVIAGIDIGGTKIAVALEDLSGEKIAVRHLPTRVELGADAIIETIFQAIGGNVRRKPRRINCHRHRLPVAARHRKWFGDVALKFAGLGQFSNC